MEQVNQPNQQQPNANVNGFNPKTIKYPFCPLHPLTAVFVPVNDKEWTPNEKGLLKCSHCIDEEQLDQKDYTLVMKVFS